MSTEAIERLGALLAVLTNDWQHRDWLLAALSDNYPERSDTATRMLTRDIRWLRTLGFDIERSEGHHEPHFRIVGHARFGAEVPSKFCSKCQQWRKLDDFTTSRHRKNGKMIYCRYCNLQDVQDWRAAHPEKYAVRMHRHNHKKDGS